MIIEVPPEEPERTIALQELQLVCERARNTQFSEISVARKSPDDVFPALSALINRDRGWLMLIRYEGDVGFSSRSADRVSSERTIEFTLGNGQVDEYPESWTLPVEEVLAALEQFAQLGVVPESIRWSNDSDDGAVGPNDFNDREPT